MFPWLDDTPIVQDFGTIVSILSLSHERPPLDQYLRTAHVCSKEVFDASINQQFTGLREPRQAHAGNSSIDWSTARRSIGIPRENVNWRIVYLAEETGARESATPVNVLTGDNRKSGVSSRSTQGLSATMSPVESLIHNRKDF